MIYYTYIDGSVFSKDIPFEKLPNQGDMFEFEEQALYRSYEIQVENLKKSLKNINSEKRKKVRKKIFKLKKKMKNLKDEYPEYFL